MLRFAGGAGLLAVAGPLLAACGSSSTKSGGPTTSAGAPNTASASTTTAATATLTMWSNHPEWKDALLKNLAVFEQATGNRIQLEQKPGPQYVSALATAMQANSGPDLAGVTPGSLLAQFEKSGYLLDLTGKVDIGGLNDVARARATSNGKVMGVPFGQYALGIYYQTDVFKKLQLSVPRTWDELKQVCKALKAGGQTPLMMPAQDPTIPAFFYMMACSSAMGPDGFEKLRKGEFKLDSPEGQAGAQLMVDLLPYYQEGFASVAYADGKASFARGKAAMMSGGSADYAGFKAINPDVKVDFFPFPSADASSKPVILLGTDLIYGVNANSKHVDQAISFIKWLTTPDADALFGNSIELPSVEGVDSTNPLYSAQLAAIKANAAVPSWRDVNETSGVWNVLAENMQKLLLKRISSADLSKLAQQAVAASS